MDRPVGSALCAGEREDGRCQGEEDSAGEAPKHCVGMPVNSTDCG